MWALKIGIDDSPYDNTLVLAFVGHTRILTLTGEEVEETEIHGFLSDQQTFYCGNVDFNQVIQVTPITARLVQADNRTLISEWKPPGDRRIGVVACNSNQLVCASACDVYYIEILENELIQKSHVTLEYEVACLDISLLDEKTNKSELIAVGLWTDISAHILKLPTLETMYSEKFGGGE